MTPQASQFELSGNAARRGLSREGGEARAE